MKILWIQRCFSNHCLKFFLDQQSCYKFIRYITIILLCNRDCYIVWLWLQVEIRKRKKFKDKIQSYFSQLSASKSIEVKPKIQREDKNCEKVLIAKNGCQKWMSFKIEVIIGQKMRIWMEKKEIARNLEMDDFIAKQKIKCHHSLLVILGPIL